MINLLIPTTGYFYTKEPKRGWCVLAVESVPLSLAFYGFAKSFGDGPGNIENGEKLFTYGALAFELIQIWSVFDVVKIAKIKKLAYQKRKITMKIKPGFLVMNQNNMNSLACGLNLIIDLDRK